MLDAVEARHFELFTSPQLVTELEDVLSRGLEALVLTNAMKPMRRHERSLLRLKERFGDYLTLRVSIDHYTRELHELERGPGKSGQGIYIQVRR